MKKEEFLQNGIRILQDDELYKFTSDSVLLSRFATVKAGDDVADFCSGSGIVGFNLLSENMNLVKSLSLFELQKPLFDLSVESIKLNGLEEKVQARNVRVQDIDKSLYGKFSLIVCNPPYMSEGRGFYEQNREIALCRTELELKLSELIDAIAKCLKFKGRVALVHRADRLAEVFKELSLNGLEPKRLQFVSGGKKEPYLFMVEAVKGGKSGIKILETVIN